MVVGEIAEPVDLLIVGGGPGGYTAAYRAAQLGREVTLVEQNGRGALGGACLHVGCIPSKALIELGHDFARVGTRPGIVEAAASVDLAAFQIHRLALAKRLAAGVGGLLDARGVDVIEGRLRFNKPDRAAIETPEGNVRFVEFADVIIASGSRPAALAALPRDGERVLDSTDALALDAVPDALVVVGAGYIGVELGTAFAQLGSRVTLVEAADRILATIDPGLTAPVVRRLDELGVEVVTGATVSALEGDEVVLEHRRVACSHIVVAVGRTPNTDELGLAELGVTAERGLIAVDGQMRARDHVAAIGDVVAGPALAHKASAEGIVAAEGLSGRAAAWDHAAVPLVVFSEPEIASVGLTLDAATAQGITAKAASFPYAASGRAATLGRREGFAQLVVDQDTDRIIGAHFVGPAASEMVAEATLALEMMASPEDVAGTIHAHPTLSEGLHEAAEAVLGRPLNMR